MNLLRALVAAHRPRRTPIFVGVALLTAACGSAAGQSVEVVAPSTTAPPVVVTTDAPRPPAPGEPAWPLTGAAAASDAAGLNGPAVVVKIDNDAAARPQVGINQADLMYELRVEGISRLIGVYHSTAASPVGPVRSARTSDPDLVANLRTPLISWSGGNPTVRDVVRRAGGIGVLLDVGYDAQSDAYRRAPDRRGPHNLFSDTATLLSLAPSTMGPPVSLFDYHEPGVPTPEQGDEVAGAWVGFSQRAKPSAEYVWDVERNVWRRFQVDARHPIERSAHVDSNGVQVSPTNLVVLEVAYRPSAADHRSPEAVSIGEGVVTVYTTGRAVSGTWQRAELADPWNLRDTNGAAITLAPGRTWVALVLPGDSGPLDPARAAELLFSRT